MRISGTEPLSVILSPTMKFKKLKSDDRKVPKQAEAKRDAVINPQKSTLELCYMCPRGLTGPPAVKLTK